jgi:EpsI family protein
MAAVVLWLIWRERQSVADAAGTFSPVMLAAAMFASIAWAVAWNAGLQAAHFVLWPAALWSGVTAALGWRAGLALMRPMAFFAFALPVWDALTPLLQTLTVRANEGLAMLLGIPVIIDNTLIHIPEGSFEIAGGCSGLNYLVVGLAIAALLGEVNRDSLRRRVGLIAVSGALALVSNWVRVFVIIYAGHASNMTHYLVRVDHYKWGWVLYSVVLTLFLLTARRLPASQRPQPADSVTPGAAPWHPRALAIAAAAMAIGLGPLLSGWPRAARLAEEGDGFEYPPAVADALGDQWQALPPDGNWLPVFAGADGEMISGYAYGGDRVTAYAATYLRQTQGRELVGFGSRLQGAGIGRKMSLPHRIMLAQPPLEVVEAEWRDPYGRRALLWWIYRVGSRDFASGGAAQLWYGVSSLWSSPRSSIVALYSECVPDCERARSALRRFSGDMLQQLLDAAGGSRRNQD